MDYTVMTSAITSLVLLLVFVVDITVPSLISRCPVKCECQRQIVTCSGLHLKSVPLDIAQDTTILDLSDNLITSIENSSITSMSLLVNLNLAKNALKFISSEALENLSSLQKLDLSENNLQNLDVSHFAPLYNLRRLVLSKNLDLNVSRNAFQRAPLITEIEIRINQMSGNYDFSGMLQLVILDLQNCRVGEFNKNNMRNLPNLKTLLLSGNELVDFPTAIVRSLVKLEILKIAHNFISNFSSQYDFGVNPKLQIIDFSKNEIESLEGIRLGPSGVLHYLDLRGNQIKRIPHSLLENRDISEMLVLNLEQNPIICDCHFKWVATMHVESSVIFKGYCETPATLAGTRATSDDLTRYTCPPRVQQTSQAHVVFIGGHISLYCPVNGEPEPSVKWYFFNRTSSANQRVDERYVNEGNKSLVFHNVTFGMAGLYICRARNVAGSVEMAMALTVVPLSSRGDALVDDDTNHISCHSPILFSCLLVVVSIGVCLFSFILYRKYLKAIRLQRNVDYATLNDIEAGGEAL